VKALLIAGDSLIQRLKVLQLLQLQARERGETSIEMHVEELFDSSDAQALEAWQKAKAEALGHQALPFEVPA
jgi:hypothetical protein